MGFESLVEGIALAAGIVLLLWWITGRPPSFRPANVAAALLYVIGVSLLRLTDAPVLLMYVLPFVIVLALWLARRRRARAI